MRARRETAARVLQFLLDNSLLLLVGAVAGLLWANVDSGGYARFTDRTHFLVNHIAMVFFFGLVAKEVYEATLPGGPLAELDRVPERVNMDMPVYPRSLQPASQAGEAVVEVLVDKSGRVQLVRILSATQPAFGYAAAQAVSSWQFRGPKKNGKPVAARLTIPVGFQPGQ